MIHRRNLSEADLITKQKHESYMNELFEEWKKLSADTFAYRTSDLGELSEEAYESMYSRYQPMYERRQSIVIELNKLGYEIVDGLEPYSRELKKIQ